MRLHPLPLLAALASCNLLLTDYQTVGPGAGVGGEPAVPLEVEGGDGGVAVLRRGQFRLEAEPESHWQWARWFYLPDNPDANDPLGPAGDPGHAIYRTTCLWTAARANNDSLQYFMHSCIASAEPDDQFEPESPPPPAARDLDALPVWFTLTGQVQSVYQTTISFTARVYASGLVWSSTRVLLTDDSAETEGIDLGFGQIALGADRFQKPASDEEGLIRMLGGDAAILSMQPDPALGASWFVAGSEIPDAHATGLWVVAPETLVAGEARTYASAFVLGAKGPLALEREARSADLRAPSLAVASGGARGAATDAGGRDPETGSYVIDVAAGATEVTFSLGAAVERFEPAFELRGWQAGRWALRLGDTVLATSEAGGPAALAAQTSDGLAFQYLGVIAAGASEPFRLTAE